VLPAAGFPIDYAAVPPLRRKAAADLVSASGTAVQHEANRLMLERYAPPGVIVDQDMQILQFRGQTGTFLEPAPGDPSMSLLKMAREGLLYGIRTAFHAARKSGAPVAKDGLKVRQNGGWLDVRIEVVPLGSSARNHFLVLFQAAHEPARKGAPRAKAEAAAKRGASAAGADRVQRLQQELAASREYLQSIIQEGEAANEGLQSANEEILSSNEELQSTNEELDTAKEELQSTNEELNTVNEELHGRNEELSRVNSDLVNLLGSVQIAIVIVASDLRIRRFTPMAERVLNLIDADVGRPISHIKPNIDCPDLEKMIAAAIDTVTPQERDVQDRQGNWYSLRIRPYKNIENRIDGAVLALFDIQTIKLQDAELRRARTYADALFESVPVPLVVLDDAFRVRQVNAAFCDAFGYKFAELESRKLLELDRGAWNPPGLREQLDAAMKDGGRGEPLRLDHTFPRVGAKQLVATTRRIDGGDGDRPTMLVALVDAKAVASA
jgi:two-component system, chemotaxis family, CheB/CheR fusion protein